MKIEKVRWKNFISYGNSWHEMTFDTTSSLNLLYGENGSGKTSIINVITFMLYGRLDDFTIKQIPNKINHNFEGEITVKSNGKTITIFRGLTPTKFDVVIDGIKLDTAGKLNVQKYLEDEVYGISYQLFKNSISLSLSDFKSFAELTPKDKKDIIDRIFGFTIINNLAAVVKERVKQVKLELDSHINKLNGFNDSLNIILENKKKIEEKTINYNVSEFEKELVDVQTVGKSITQEMKLKKVEIDKSLDTINSITDNIVRCRHNIQQVKEKIDLYKSGKCPTCGANLGTDDHRDLQVRLEKKYEDLNDKMSVFNTEINKVKVAHNTFNSEYNTLALKLNEAKAKVLTLSTRIEERKSQKQESTDDYEKMINDIYEKMQPIEQNKVKLNNTMSLFKIISEMLSDNGIKQYMSNVYIPTLNFHIQSISNRLNIRHKIVFDAQYNCKIYMLGEEMSYRNLSNGERKRVDLTLTIAFLKFLKTKIPDMNVLFLDEVMSSIDVAGCNEIIDILKEISNDIGLNTFIVHHANLDNSTFDKIISVSKINGFSQFTVL